MGEQSISGPGKTVRVFVSSTFRDMHAERDYLVTVVFPELRERCERLGLEFFDVDLRWGVPERSADGEKANSWEYCRQWIDRVEPLFICILGQRYGWVPEPDQLRGEEDRRRQKDRPRSVTDLEVRHAVLDGGRKRRSYFYLRATPVPEVAAAASDTERARYSEYVDGPDLQARLEELRADVAGCGRPVRSYGCKWERDHFEAMDDEFGPRVLEDLWSAILRDDRYVSKELWRQVLGKDPDDDPRYVDESAVIPEEIAAKLVELAKPAPVSALEAELQQMEAFAASRLRWFTGRCRELGELAGFVDACGSDDPRLAVVAAAPGQGKSALLAKLQQEMKSSSHLVIAHFIGATARSADAGALVQRLLDELDRYGISLPAGTDEGGTEAKRDFNSLCGRLARRLGDYSGDRRIVVLLDAVNQLSDGHELNWLPQRLAPNVRIVVSCVEDPAASEESPEQWVRRSLAARFPAALRVSLGELEDEDVRSIAVAYLREYCHELDAEHLETLCAIRQTHNPLYLLVMLNELRTLGGNDLNRVVPARIAAMPQDHPDTVKLFKWVLQKLEVFNQQCPDAVRWWCLYLVHSRAGLASHELAELLNRKLGGAAVATSLRIERGLRRYLQRRGPQLDFFHGQLREAALELYGTSTAPATCHGDLAGYFLAVARGRDVSCEWENGEARGFSECIYHLLLAGECETAGELLSSFPFLLHKLRVGLLAGVLEDYRLCRRHAPGSVVQRVSVWAAFFREKAHLLRRGNSEWPAHKIFLQLAVEHGDDSPLSQGAERWLASGRCDWLWWWSPHRPARAPFPACIAVLEGHTSLVAKVVVGEGGWLISQGGPDDHTLRLWNGQLGECRAVMEGHTGRIVGVRVLPRGQAVSWSEDGTLRLWSTRTGLCQAVLAGHASTVQGAELLDDGRLVSWSDDATLRIWNLVDGSCERTLAGHQQSITSVLAIGDGHLISGSSDGALLEWDVARGERDGQLEGHSARICGIIRAAQGLVVSWASDTTLRVWDVTQHTCRAVLSGHRDPINGALVLPSGLLVSWSGEEITVVINQKDNTLRVWELDSGRCVAVLEGHDLAVLGALVLADGRVLSWSNDGTMRIWVAETGKCVLTLSGHDEKVYNAIQLRDGRILSCSFDGTLRVWDPATGQCLGALEGHTGLVYAALETPDGTVVSWGSDGSPRVWDVQHVPPPAEQAPNAVGCAGSMFMLDDERFIACGVTLITLWNARTGYRVATLRGHGHDKMGYAGILGQKLLKSGRLLSWSMDGTLRVWDISSGKCVSAFFGHDGVVRGAIELRDGRILSWSWEPVLLITTQETAEVVVRCSGHQRFVNGAVELPDGRLLSWCSDDQSMRVWEPQTGECLRIIEGPVTRVLNLDDGRVVSWAGEKGAPLQVYDTRTGERLQSLAHSFVVEDAAWLEDGKILAWSRERDFQLWDIATGAILAACPESVAFQRYPQWACARERRGGRHRVQGDFFFLDRRHCARLLHQPTNCAVAVWQADSLVESHLLLADGTGVVHTDDGHVCSLKLHYGNWRVSLDTAQSFGVPRKDPQGETAHGDEGAAAESGGHSLEGMLFTGLQLCLAERGFGHGRTLQHLDRLSYGVENDLRPGCEELAKYLVNLHGSMADYYEKQADAQSYERASYSLEHAAAIVRRLDAAYPQEPLYAKAYAGCLFRLGRHWQKGVAPDAAQRAAESLTACIGVYGKAHGAQPDDPAVTKGLAFAHLALADVALKCQMSLEAKNSLLAGAALLRELSGSGDPDVAPMLEQISQTLRQLAMQDLPQAETVAPSVRDAAASAGEVAEAPRVRSRRKLSLEELRKSAASCFEKGMWEVAARELQMLLDAGEPLAVYAPKLVTCLLKPQEEPLETRVKRVEVLLEQLRQAGHADLAGSLREQLQESLPAAPRRKWWKLW